ncbi:protein NASP homolog [Anopheles arabiensis]|uniref:Tetratricopeptide SHNi-TPR domain-containing protein n=1 Tax=Anopheles arabiensis TaxID=7173 RepID=A0A182HTJ6_ANOAR|nr:protein NASP homolog [Anopheles arabiensis]XP_040152296.1 protein NASP homolog [Anopheles arabiensis]XP_040152297.1 protein NASP homolog [Anopheles arabiensis]
MAEKSETLVTKEEKVNEAKELFGRGSRNYCMKQYADAADDLSACCSIYSELYGPNAEELGLPYLMYAKSLIALGKDENNLIAAADDGEEVDEDDEEDEEGEEGGEEEEGAAAATAEGGEEEKAGEESAEKEKDGEAMDTKDEAASVESSATEKEKEKDGEKEKEHEKEKDGESSTAGDKVEAKAEAGVSSTSSDVNGEPQPGPSTSNGDTSVQEDNADNLQVAWEILELAVHIFQQQGDKGYENLPECYTELAGISFENSFFKEAIKDYVKALEIYQKTKQPDLRLLAEVNYKVGLCYMMEREFEESINSFKGAVAELEKVVEEEKAKEQTDDIKETIQDLEQMKKEILEKIADVEEAMKTPIEDVKRELSKIIVSGEVDTNGKDLNNGAGTSSAGGSSSSNGSTSKLAAKPATDISHLIKRKKPDSASMEVEGSPAKKTASEADNAATHNTST